MPFPKVFVSDVKAAQRHACNVNKGNKQSQQSWRLSTESFNGAQKKALRGEKFGGAPADLPTTDLPTNSNVARYFYLLSSQEKDYKTQIDLVRQKLNDVWSKCNTRLPVIEEKSLHTKIKRFLDKVKQLNAGKLSVSLALNVQKTKDKLFDIAACNCSLQTHPCDSKVVRCSIENCEKEHIICECPNDRRIPAEERSYMRDQRAKVGTRGAYQMGTKERSRAVKKKVGTSGGTVRPRKRVQQLEQIIVNPDMSFEASTLLYAVPVPYYCVRIRIHNLFAFWIRILAILYKIPKNVAYLIICI